MRNMQPSKPKCKTIIVDMVITTVVVIIITMAVTIGTMVATTGTTKISRQKLTITKQKIKTNQITYNNHNYEKRI